MRRAALLGILPVLLLLVGCGGGSTSGPGAGSAGVGSVDGGSADLAAFKQRTDVPDCPQVAARGVDGGMPAVTVLCLGGGRPVDVSGLRGPMIVNFWASWCGDCRKEMPALAAYDRGQSEVKVLGVDFLDPQPGAALELAQQSKVAYPLVADPKGSLDKASPLPHIPGLPLTVFLDSTGRIAHIEAGAMLTEADVKAAVQRYLGVGG